MRSRKNRIYKSLRRSRKSLRSSRKSLRSSRKSLRIGRKSLRIGRKSLIRSRKSLRIGRKLKGGSMAQPNGSMAQPNNCPPLSLDKLAILKKYADNVTKYPGVDKYRRLKLRNDIFINIWNNKQAQAILINSGWKPDTDNIWVELDKQYTDGNILAENVAKKILENYLTFFFDIASVREKDANQRNSIEKYFKERIMTYFFRAMKIDYKELNRESDSFKNELLQELNKKLNKDKNYMMFVELLSEPLQRYLLVKGGRTQAVSDKSPYTYFDMIYNSIIGKNDKNEDVSIDYFTHKKDLYNGKQRQQMDILEKGDGGEYYGYQEGKKVTVDGKVEIKSLKTLAKDRHIGTEMDETKWNKDLKQFIIILTQCLVELFIKHAKIVQPYMSVASAWDGMDTCEIFPVYYGIPNHDINDIYICGENNHFYVVVKGTYLHIDITATHIKFNVRDNGYCLFNALALYYYIQKIRTNPISKDDLTCLQEGEGKDYVLINTTPQPSV